MNAPAPSKLPDHVGAKLRMLDIIADEARTLAAVTKDRLNKLQGQVDMGHKVEAAEVAELQEAQARHLERFQRTTDLLANLRNFIGRLPPNMQIDPWVAPNRTRLLPGKSPAHTVELLRLEIINTRTALFGIERAPLPRKDAEAAIGKWIDDMLARGMPHPSVSGGELKLAFGDAGSEFEHFGPQRLVAIGMWLSGASRSDMVKRIAALLPEPKADTLSHGQRAAKIAELKELILNLERQEEMVITRAQEDSGVTLLRRAEADPRAVLGIVVGRRARAAA